MFHMLIALVPSCSTTFRYVYTDSTLNTARAIVHSYAPNATIGTLDNYPSGDTIGGGDVFTATLPRHGKLVTSRMFPDGKQFPW